MIGGQNKPKTSSGFSDSVSLMAKVKAMANSAAEPYRKEVGPVIDWGQKNGLWGLPFEQTPIGRMMALAKEPLTSPERQLATYNAVGGFVGSLNPIGGSASLLGESAGNLSTVKAPTKAPIINPDIEKTAIEKYNAGLETPREQYMRWAADKAGTSYREITYKDMIDTYGAESEAPPQLVKVLEDHGKAIEILSNHGNEVDYFPPHKAPTFEKHIEETVADQGGVFPAKSLADIDYTKSANVYDAFRHIVENEGWVVKGRDSKYFTLEKASPNGPIEVGVRIADHNNTSSVGHAIYGKSKVNLNIAPTTDGGVTGRHDIEDAIKRLRSARVDQDGNLFWGEKPAHEY